MGGALFVVGGRYRLNIVFFGAVGGVFADFAVRGEGNIGFAARILCEEEFRDGNV
jgi:hypothetical protein